MKSTLLAPLFALSLAGCGGASSSAPPPPPPPAAAAPTASAAPATFAEQVELGGKLYGENCASCHGASGSGGKAPPVVGLSKGALPLNPPATAKYRKSQFKTVADVADFAVKTMPPTAPGSLSGEQYWAILAFDLKANGINLEKKLDGTVAQGLTIPR